MGRLKKWVENLIYEKETPEQQARREQDVRELTALLERLQREREEQENETGRR